MPGADFPHPVFWLCLTKNIPYDIIWVVCKKFTIIIVEEMDSISMKKKNNFELAYDAVKQLDIIVGLFTWLFAIIPHSVYYGRWDEAARAFVRNANIVNSVVMTVLVAFTIYGAVRLKKFKKLGGVIICSTIIFVLHIVIRYNMLGSYQWSDAREYFTKLEWTLYYPNILMFDPMRGGTICSHIAHGFMFVSMLGQFINTSTGMGFQYSYMVLGAASAVCLFNIFRVIFPKKKLYVCAISGFIVSIQPMFLGLSTSMQMEYPLAVLFIFALCSFLTNKHILMFFWLIMLGTCKETGAMMAFSMLFFILLFYFIDFVKKSGGFKAALKKIKVWQYIAFTLFMMVCIIVFIKILFMPAWGGVRIINVLKFGGEGRLNFQFEGSHFFMKARQLFILNFSWLWIIILMVCLVVMAAVPAVRRNRQINTGAFLFIIIQYFVYTGFLLFFLEAKGTRYNILSDVLLLFIVVTMVIRVLDRWFSFVPVSMVIAGLAFVETFVTIDPVSLAVFTSVNTGAMPMVWTAATKKELPYVDINIGDFGYYNYQYTYMDRAVDNMLEAVDYQGWFRILSSFKESAEDQFNNSSLVWDSKLKHRTYKPCNEEERYHAIERVYYLSELEQWDFDDRCIYVELPWSRNHTEEAKKALSEYYIFEGPYTSSVGRACSLEYYILYLR